MKLKLLCMLFLLVLTLATGCRKEDWPEENTPCIESKILDFQRHHGASARLSVYEYVIDEKTYYLFIPDCCDQFDELWDANCNYVCAPSGGFTGAGDGNCPVWSGTPRLTLIWSQN